MTVIGIIYTYVYPLILLAAGLTRINAISLFYLVAFFVNTIWSPTKFLPKRATLATILTWVVCVVAGLALVGHATFQTVMATSSNRGEDRLPSNSTAAEIISFIGFSRIRDVGQGFRFITPDVVTFVISLILAIFFKRTIVFPRFTKVELENEKKPKLPLLHSHLVLLLIFILAVSKPALPQLIYFLFFIVVTLVKSLAHLSVTKILQKLFPIVFGFTILFILSIYAYQIPWVYTNIPSKIANALGYIFYEDIQPVMSHVTIVISWVAAFLLYILLTIQHKVQCIHAYGEGGMIDSNSKAHDTVPASSKAYESLLRRAIRRVGWPICLLALLFVALFIPSILGFVLLCTVCIASMVPRSFLEKHKLVPVLLVYFSMAVVAQYVYNVDLEFPESPQLSNIGLIHWKELAWLHIGVQGIAAYMLSIYWSYADPLEARRYVGLDDEEIKPELPGDSVKRYATQSLPRDKMATVRGLKKAQTLTAKSRTSLLRRTTAFFQNAAQSQHAQKVKSVLKALGLWLLQQSYLLSLAGLYIAGLLRVNLLNTGYMLIFIIFLSISYLAKKIWFVLVLYTEAVILLVYVWDALSAWTEPVQEEHSRLIKDIIGLRTFDSAGDLFIQGLLRHFVIMLFSVIQFHVNNFSSRQQKTMEDARAQLPEWMKVIGRWFSENWAYWGLIPVYFVLVMVTVLDELTVPNLLYLLWFFICLIVHIRSRNPIAILRRIWLIIVLVSGINLIARYAFQFVDVAKIDLPDIPPDAIFTLVDFGLYTFNQDAIFVKLLGNTAVFLISVVQMRAFFSKKVLVGMQLELDDEPDQVSKWPVLASFLQFVKRLAMLHIYKITFLILILVSLSPICGINSIYMCIALFSLLMETGSDNMGLLILIYSKLAALAQLLYQFPGPQRLAPDIVPWLGLRASTSRWALIQPYIFLSIFLVFQRLARRAKDDWIASRPFESVAPETDVQRQPTSELTLFSYPKVYNPQRVFSFSYFIVACKWYISNLLTIHSYQFFVMAMLLLVIVRYDFVLAPVYVAIVGISLITRTSRWKRDSKSLRFLAISLGVVIFMQYIINLNTPPGPIQFPWVHWKPPPIFSDIERTKSWLGLNLKNRYVLVADYLALFILSRVMLVDSKSIRSTSYWVNIIDSPVEYEDFLKPRHWSNSIRYYLFRFSVFWVLLFVFAAGTVEPDILSVGYVAFSLWFIFRESQLYRRRNKLWKWARIYNWVLLLAKTLYQLPLIPVGDGLPNSFPIIVGLKKLDGPKDLIFDVVIFILLHAQKIIFERKEFDYVVRYLLDEEERGIRLAHERFQQWKKDQAEQLRKVEEEKKRRRQQLDLLKAARERQQKLWENMGGFGGQSAGRGLTLLPGATAAFPEFDPRMRTLATTEDLKRLQEAGALEIEEDVAAGKLHMRFTGAVVEPVSPSKEHKQTPPPTPAKEEIIVEQPAKRLGEIKEERYDSGSESSSSNEFEISYQSDIEHGEGDSNAGDPDDDPDDAVDEEQLEKGRCCECRTPQFLLDATDKFIEFLDRFTYTPLQKLDASRPKKVFVGLYKVYQRYSHLLCYLAFLINALLNANILSMFYPLSMFVYALLDVPRPHKRYWNLMFIYTSAVILLKFVFQIPVFCICSQPVHDTWSVYPWCTYPASYKVPLVPSNTICEPVTPSRSRALFEMSYPQVIGLIKLYYPALPGIEEAHGLPFVFSVLPDLVVLIAVFMHRYWLKKTGYWAFVKQYHFKESSSDHKQDLAEARHFQRIMIHHMKKRERWLQMEAVHRQMRLEKIKRRLAKGKADLSDKAMIERDLQEVQELIIDNPIFGDNLAEVQDDENISIVMRDSIHSPYDDEFGISDTQLTSKADAQAQAAQPTPEEPASGAATPILPDTSATEPSDVPLTRKSTRRLLIMSPSTRRELEKQEAEKEFQMRKEAYLRSQQAAEQERERRRAQRRSQEYQTIATPDQPIVTVLGDQPDDTVLQPLEDEEAARKQDASGSAYPSEYPFQDSQDGSESEYEEEEHSEFSRRMRQTAHDIYMFYKNVFSDKIDGRDLYVAIWFIELLCFVYILVLPSAFLGGVTTNVGQYLSSGRSIPMLLVLTLLVQFMLIIIERIIYLFRAIKAKVVLQYVLVIFYHFYLWWWLPSQNGGYFYEYPSLIVFYIFKFIYLYLSAMQISYGYPLFVQGQFLTDSKNPGLLRMFVFMAYRAIPFVYELRTLLDWTITSTTLTFYEWLKLEDIYAQLFLVKCRVCTDRAWERDVGDKTSVWSKLLVGALIFSVLVAVIWLPLLILMQGSPGATTNFVTTAELKIGFQSHGIPFFWAVSQNVAKPTDIDPDLFRNISRHHDWVSQDDQKLMQVVDFQRFSDTNWAISPPARAELLAALLANTTVNVVAQLTFVRERAVQNVQSLALQTSPVALTQDAREGLLDILTGRNYSAVISIPDFMPRYYRLPILPPIEPQPGRFSVTLRLQRNSTQVDDGVGNYTRVDEYWVVEQEPQSDPGDTWDESGIQIVTFSSEVPSLSFVESFASSGIIGLYVGIVAVVGRFLRLSITDLSYRIIYEDLPECDEVISYCEDIFLARQDGDLRLEEELYRELIELYRSPERLILRTLPKGPRFAGRNKRYLLGESDKEKQD